MSMYDLIRKTFEANYDCVATVMEYKKVKDADTKVTSFQEVVVLEHVPCRLSFERVVSASEGTVGVGVAQTVKLFLTPTIQIKPGSKIIVASERGTGAYEASGVPAIYPTHQEILLTIFRGWA